MKPDRIKLIQIVYNTLGEHKKQDLQLARDIVDRLAATMFFNSAGGPKQS